MASPEPALTLEGISAAYGPRPVIHDLSLSLAAGEVVAMLGHNGAGKTTALRIAAGLKSPSRGRVRLFGRDARGMSAARRAGAGMAFVPDGVRGLFPTLTVRQNLDAIARPNRHRNGDWESVEEHLREAFRPVLVDRLDQVAGSMSGGQRQMLAISLALLRRPSVLLLDEPSTGLAPIIVDSIFDVVRDVGSRTGTAVLLVEQDVTHALKIATRVVIVQSGEVVVMFPRAECPPATELWRHF